MTQDRECIPHSEARTKDTLQNFYGIFVTNEVLWEISGQMYAHSCLVIIEVSEKFKRALISFKGHGSFLMKIYSQIPFQ